MLVELPSRFLLSLPLSLALFAATSLPLHAQVTGAPASVTSLGFGGNFINGVRSSVTSLGPNSYSNNQPLFGNCCANFFLPANPNPPLFSGRRHHRKDKDKDKDRDKDRHRDHNFFAVGASEPVYVPYAVPYDEQGDDDSPSIDSRDADSSEADSANALSPDVDYPRGVGPLNRDSIEKRAPTRHSVVDADAVAHPQKPVASQPSTVLVFKDGRRSEIRNYAVVGDTLFDFASDRTHKILLADLDLQATRQANDQRGVDFEIPDATSR